MSSGAQKSSGSLFVEVAVKLSAKGAMSASVQVPHASSRVFPVVRE
jgi:hypothetical protein